MPFPFFFNFFFHSTLSTFHILFWFSPMCRLISSAFRTVYFFLSILLNPVRIHIFFSVLIGCSQRTFGGKRTFIAKKEFQKKFEKKKKKKRSSRMFCIRYTHFILLWWYFLSLSNTWPPSITCCMFCYDLLSLLLLLLLLYVMCTYTQYLQTTSHKFLFSRLQILFYEAAQSLK